MKYINSLLIACLLLLAGACSSSKSVVYFQDIQPQAEEAIANMNLIKAQPGDELSIVVTCKDPKIASLFNLVTPNNRLLAEGEAVYRSSDDMSTYLVSQKGDIDFPQLGEMHVGGLTREEIAKEIKDKLVASGLVVDPVVTVNFTNLHVAVMGEVLKPGSYALSNDRTTLLDALSAAGDLTIYGVRENVAVVREEDGKRKTYTVDLRSKDLFNSPVYYLQQNDVVYVAPNKTRAGQSSVNENQWKSASLWMSIASVLTSVAILIWK